ncbi:MAG: hypothetical protein E6Q88_14775 [Lysobacteraceae bacterium]|nr:MAG: hypothetical protein E6Q88_14775 [Xanthomonadaceae bacterium]
MRSISCALIACFFTMLLGASAPAKAEVTELGWPYPPNNLEAYPLRNQYPPLCNPTNKPGPERLRQLLSFWFGAPNQFNPNWHIGRPCNVSSTSYHREGRALDFYVNATEPRAQSIVNWILATDEYGNPHSKARRMGIIEIIWKDSIWSSDQAGAGFRRCDSCGPHYDHIHFSFSREGANMQTSWFTTNDNVSRAACTGGTAEVKYWTYPSGFGPLRHVRRIAAPGGTYTTQSALAASPWRVYSSLGPTTVTANSPVSALYGARAFLGACTVTLF